VKCPSCGADLKTGFLYLRGIGGSLFWSTQKDVALLSRRGLEHIDLNRLGLAGAGGQTILDAHRCPSCSTIVFKSA